jgi:hypothetical protein
LFALCPSVRHSIYSSGDWPTLLVYGLIDSLWTWNLPQGRNFFGTDPRLRGRGLKSKYHSPFLLSIFLCKMCGVEEVCRFIPLVQPPRLENALKSVTPRNNFLHFLIFFWWTIGKNLGKYQEDQNVLHRKFSINDPNMILSKIKLENRIFHQICQHKFSSSLTYFLYQLFN